MKSLFSIIVLVLLFSCNETVINNKQWLLKQKIANGFIYEIDSIDKILFNFDTNELQFRLCVAEPEILKRDREVAKFWLISYHGNFTTFVNKQNKSNIFTRHYVEGCFQYRFTEN